MTRRIIGTLRLGTRPLRKPPSATTFLHHSWTPASWSRDFIGSSRPARPSAKRGRWTRGLGWVEPANNPHDFASSRRGSLAIWEIIDRGVLRIGKLYRLQFWRMGSSRYYFLPFLFLEIGLCMFAEHVQRNSYVVVSEGSFLHLLDNFDE